MSPLDYAAECACTRWRYAMTWRALWARIEYGLLGLHNVEGVS